MQHGRGRRPTTKISLRFPSPDARLRGTGGDAGGWQGISGGRLRSVWPTAEDRRGCEGIGGDSLGLVCKIAGNAYPGSNPGPATPILTCGNAASAGLGYPGRVCRVFLRFSSQDAARTRGVAGRCCVWRSRAGSLPDQRRRSDSQDQLTERKRHSPVGRRLNCQFVVTSAEEVLHKGMPGDDGPGAAVLLETPHRSQPCFSRPWSASMGLFVYCSVRCQAAGTTSSSTIGEVAAWTVVTSAGVTLVVLMACWKNRRAAVASRRGETNTSMTWPNWSTARYT